MFSSCVFCNRDLGRNETIETFPVGRRLAFDPAKGRLWVVCPSCERWNLTPLEERWEAIEQANELFGATRIRASSDHIGLARLGNGLELVRIGQPLRPEFAGWRYGDQFGRRRRRQILLAGAGVGALGAAFVGGAIAGVGIGGFGWGAAQVGKAIIHGRPDAIVARIRTREGEVLPVRRRHLTETRLTRGTDGVLAIDLRYKGGARHFDGPEAARIAAVLVPKVNRFGAASDVVQQAVREIDESGGTEGFLDRLSTGVHVTTAPATPKKRNKWSGGDVPLKKGLYGLPVLQRLALEMALHEDAERRAIEGELDVLRRAWEDAEEVAAIADNLLLPDRISRLLGAR